MKKRDFKLSDYNISKEKYMELKYFCMQYDDKKRLLNYGVQSMVSDGLPKGNLTGSPTERAAVKNLKIKKEIEVIELTAKEADPVIYQYIIKNVTQGIRYEDMPVPCGRRQFYESRRIFFFLLSQRR